MPDDALRNRLIEAARNGRLLRYGEIAPAMGLRMDDPNDRGDLGRMLDAINQYENDANRPLLSAVVVGAETGMPGAGFFPMARRLGYLVGDDERVFWARAVASVYDCWGAPAIR